VLVYRFLCTVNPNPDISICFLLRSRLGEYSKLMSGKVDEAFSKNSTRKIEFTAGILNKCGNQIPSKGA
jgi:hypothetical protein